MHKQTSVQPEKKPHFSIGQIVTLVIFGLGTLWLIITCAVPLAIGDGVDKHTGIQRRLAEVIVDLTELYNGPQSPSPMPDFMFRVRIDEIHPVTKEETTEFCKDPAYITEDPNDPHFYTVVVTEQYLLSLSLKKTTYVGCNHTDYIYTQAFGYPEGRDPRVRLPLPN